MTNWYVTFFFFFCIYSTLNKQLLSDLIYINVFGVYFTYLSNYILFYICEIQNSSWLSVYLCKCLFLFRKDELLGKLTCLGNPLP